MTKPLPSFAKPSEARSANMRSIRSKGNRTTEWRLRSLLVRNKITGWRLGSESYPGNPDFVFPKRALAIFIDGCFWHGCPLCGHTPKTNATYWRSKIERNKERDKRNSRRLRRSGFKVVRIWECALKKKPSICLQRIVSQIR